MIKRQSFLQAAEVDIISTVDSMCNTIYMMGHCNNEKKINNSGTTGTRYNFSDSVQNKIYMTGH